MFNQPLGCIAPDLARLLSRSMIRTAPKFRVAQISYQTVRVPMRDGVQLATDLYLPPELPAPAIAMRTPYGRSADNFVGTFLFFARRGYAVIAQDCRGTGDSEPDSWDYYVYEAEDGYDLVEWVSHQSWCNGFLGSCGGSYVGQTQWPMARHPRMSTIVPELSGLGIAVNTAHLHLSLDAYARSIGKGEGKRDVPNFELERQMLDETLASGYFNEPLHRPLPDAILESFPALRAQSPSTAKRELWGHYCSLTGAQRSAFIRSITGTSNVTVLDVESLGEIFGPRIAHDAHALPHPRPAELCRSFQLPILLRTGWYDWGLNDTLATWTLLTQGTAERRLVIAPSAHAMPGYHEGMAEHPELHHAYGVTTNAEMLLHWYETVRHNKWESWPAVIYYLMGANVWQASDTWPPRQVTHRKFYLASGRSLSPNPPSDEPPDHYAYDPRNPTPTVGGSIVSSVYPPGSVDVSAVQRRPDVLVFTTPPLERDLDVVGPLRLILYASSSAVDTDFVARLSDVFPDGRAIQLQNGILRARYRDLDREPRPLVPGEIYRLEIDLWATANRFKAGHRLRVDISSADFPRWDRNTNRAGEPGGPVVAHQRIYHDAQHPSHLLVSVA
jgi:uncharacterized protein